MKLKHTTAKASHYDKEAQHYDSFNEERSAVINKTIENILKKHNVKTVLDLTCGTGSQVFYLHQQGYDVIGSDFNAKMLEVARNKALQQKLNIKFIQGDMREVQVEQLDSLSKHLFDAVITIFNAIGHVTKSDFEKTIQNVHANLKPNGLYIFDIFNLDYMLHENNITKLTIDWQTVTKNIKAREIQYSTIDQDGTLASYTILHEQTDDQQPQISQSFQTLQIYTAQQLKNMLEKNGFKVLAQTDVDGSEFKQFESERILTVAQKVK
jgi:2-polyprenyl-3-methyl-5-hydroxy-6-metoxy-1,4-benzoquinol methylase